MVDEPRTPFWAKCTVPTCGHIWPAAYLPMPIDIFARLAKAACPMCGSKKAVVAKQDGGRLLEPARGVA